VKSKREISWLIAFRKEVKRIGIPDAHGNAFSVFQKNT
jgi:hypothetical protein